MLPHQNRIVWNSRSALRVICVVLLLFDDHLRNEISGILGSSPLQTVEKLDIRANKWVYVAEMSIPRVDAGAGSISLL